MTRDQLDAIRARVEAATPGPWEPSSDTLTWIHVEAHGLTVAECRTYLNRQHTDAQNDANAAFIAKAREDVPALLAEVERLTAEIKDAESDAELAETQLDEIVELVGEGGDGSAFGSVESMLADFKEREETLVKQRDAAFKRGVAAMREAAAVWVADFCSFSKADRIRALPDPEDKS